jgi:preprotein translocase subunit SecG
VIGALLLLPTWPRLKHGITIVHEAGHGFAATVTGRRLAGIRLHSDTSGLTVSLGRPRGPGMALTLLAGYPAPSAAGVLVAAAVAAGHAAIALWGAIVLLLLVLVQIRNWYGLWSVLGAGAVVGAVTWFADPAWQMRAALALAALLVLGGLRAAVELPGARRGDGGSDADQLARITRVPVAVWLLLFVVLGLAAVAGAGALLVAPLAAALRP